MVAFGCRTRAGSHCLPKPCCAIDAVVAVKLSDLQRDDVKTRFSEFEGHKRRVASISVLTDLIYERPVQLCQLSFKGI